MDTVYIETSVVSQATAWPSKNPAIAVLQAQAKQRLETEAPKFQLVTSQFVIDEASRGDSDAAKRRLAALENVGLLLPDPDVESLADKIVTGCMMPRKARLDALQVASAVLAGVDYLLTQNCRHIANATELPRLYRLLEDLQLPRIWSALQFNFWETLRMTSNPILDEIHATREKLLAEHGGDLHAYIEAARQRALESGRPIYQPKQRTKHYIEVADQPVPNGGSTPATG